jgi:hypothetical protein
MTMVLMNITKSVLTFIVYEFLFSYEFVIIISLDHKRHTIMSKNKKLQNLPKSRHLGRYRNRHSALRAFGFVHGMADIQPYENNCESDYASGFNLIKYS